VASLLALVVSARAQAPTDQEKAADWKKLAQISQKFSWEFMSESSFTKNGEKYVAAWNEWKKEFVPFFEEFKKKYGATWEEVEKSFTGIEKPMGCNRDLVSSFSGAQGVDIPAHELRVAEWAEKFAREQYNLWQNQVDTGSDNIEVMMRRADRALRFMKLARKLNEKGSYDDKIKACQEAVDKTLPEFKKQLKEKKWPGPNADYSGPNKPDELAKAAIEFIKNHPKWTAPEFDDEHTPLAAAVAGSAWEVSKRAPLTEQPTQYSLKMLVAFGGKKDAELVYCYYMEFYTEERAGVEPGLPFRYCNSRQYECYRMLRENLPK
jgi:hypothetical protein